MSAIRLRKEYDDAATPVPHWFIDEYMADANGEFVKVYLYLLRSLSRPNDEPTVSSVADALSNTEGDVMRALRFWEDKGLLSLSYDESGELSRVAFLAPLPYDSHPTLKGHPANKEKYSPIFASGTAFESESGAFSSSDEKITQFPDQKLPARRRYRADDLAVYQKDPAVRELFFVLETYLKRPLGPSEMDTILYWYDGMHFSSDLIQYLAEYCISKGHSSLHYMDRVAQSWQEEGIHSVEEAKEHAATHSRVYYAVMKAFGITGRNLTEEETRTITRWTSEYGFDLPLILEACRRTMNAICQPSFAYADTILTNWHKENIRTMDDVASYDESYSKSKKAPPAAERSKAAKDKFHNFNQRDYDYEELELYLNNTVRES